MPTEITAYSSMLLTSVIDATTLIFFKSRTTKIHIKAGCKIHVPVHVLGFPKTNFQQVPFSYNPGTVVAYIPLNDILQARSTGSAVL